MRHLVIGGAGFLGAHVCARLLRDGEEPIAFDVNTSNVLQHIVGEEVARKILVRGDVMDALAVLEAARSRGADTIIHLAVVQGADLHNHLRTGLRVNSEGFLNSLETARILGLKRVVYASSNSVVGLYREGDTVPVDSPYKPRGVYGASKILNEMLALHYATAYGINSSGLRFTVMFGPGLGVKRAREESVSPKTDGVPMTSLWGGVISELLDKPIRGLPGRMPFGDDVANWLWVEDSAHAVTLAARSTLPGARAYNMTGDVRPVREAVETVHRLIPNADIESLPGRHGNQATIETSPIRDDLGWELEWPMERQLEWLVNHPGEGIG